MSTFKQARQRRGQAEATSSVAHEHARCVTNERDMHVTINELADAKTCNQRASTQAKAADVQDIGEMFRGDCVKRPGGLYKDFLPMLNRLGVSNVVFQRRGISKMKQKGRQRPPRHNVG